MYEIGRVFRGLLYVCCTECGYFRIRTVNPGKMTVGTTEGKAHLSTRELL